MFNKVSDFASDLLRGKMKVKEKEGLEANILLHYLLEAPKPRFSIRTSEINLYESWIRVY